MLLCSSMHNVIGAADSARLLVRRTYPSRGSDLPEQRQRSGHELKGFITCSARLPRLANFAAELEALGFDDEVEAL